LRPRRFGEIDWDGPVARTLRKKRCSRGHLKSGDNLYISPDGQNICRTCVRENQARWRDEKREQYRAYHREAERNKRAKNSSSTPSMSTFPTDGTHDSPFIPRGSKRYRDLYRGRGAV
jgi:hypothetical protein